jgi:hypothetical protein
MRLLVLVGTGRARLGHRDVKVQDDIFYVISKLDEKCRVVVKTPCEAT